MCMANKILTFNLPNLTNRFLEGNGRGYLEAGLPNITGTTKIVGDQGIRNADPQGAFYTGGSIGSGIPTRYSSFEGFRIGFNASRSSSIYGNSNTVQPATCKCYFCIKY